MIYTGVVTFVLTFLPHNYYKLSIESIHRMLNMKCNFVFWFLDLNYLILN